MGDALLSLVDGTRTGTREQRIHTPAGVVRALRGLWPEGIALDPCGSPPDLATRIESGGWVEYAPGWWCARPETLDPKKPAPKPKNAEEIAAFFPPSIVGAADQCYPEIGRDGLAEAWPERTYFNPPFDALAPWLAKYRAAWEVVGLVPVRTHRRWFRESIARSTSVHFLDPLKFVGHSAAFPAPLCLLYRGAAPSVLAHFVGVCKLASEADHTIILSRTSSR